MVERPHYITTGMHAVICLIAAGCAASHAAAARPLLPPRFANDVARHDVSRHQDELYSLRLNPAASAEQPSPRHYPLVGSGGLGAFMAGTIARAHHQANDTKPVTIDPSELEPMRLSPRVQMRVGRTTALQDGGIGGQRHALSPPDGHLSSYSESGRDGSAEFDLYDLSLSYEAFNPGAVSVSITGGMRAIRAEVGQTRFETTPGGQLVSTLDQDHDIIALPVVGTGVRWDLSRGVYISGTAATHAISDRGTFVDLTAETGIRLRPNIGFTAGYQRVRSGVDVRDLRAELDEEGIFARLQIRF